MLEIYRAVAVMMQFVRVLMGFAGLQVLNLVFALPSIIMMFRSVMLTFGCVIPLISRCM